MAQARPELLARARHSALEPETLLRELLAAGDRRARGALDGLPDDGGAFPASGSDLASTLPRPRWMGGGASGHTTQFLEAAQNVVFIGGPGTGKTHLATAIGIEAIQRHGRRAVSSRRWNW